MNFYKAFQYLKYRATARHWKGYEIQPPFAFDFVRRVMREKTEYYCFEEIETYRERLLDDKRVVEVIDFGAGSKVFKSHRRNVADMALNCSTSEWDAKLIFRMLQETKPKVMLELGTSLGIGTLYLAHANKLAKVYTIEGCAQTAAIAREGFARFNLSNVQLLVGTFDELLPNILENEPVIDFVYIDGNHRKVPTLTYFNTILPKLTSNSVVVIDDIYWSKEMTEAWPEIIARNEVRISFDIFKMGILFFREGCLKQHYKVWI